MTTTRDAIADVWGPRTPSVGEGQWPERVDERTLEKPEQWVPSTCVLCSTGCALEIGVREGRMVGVRGRAVDRVNRGRLGPKGMHGWIAGQAPGRLTEPLVRRNGKLQPASWDEAMDLIVGRSRMVLEKDGSGAIGFYTTGQIMLEDYYTIARVAERHGSSR